MSAMESKMTNEMVEKLYFRHDTASFTTTMTVSVSIRLHNDGIDRFRRIMNYEHRDICQSNYDISLDKVTVQCDIERVSDYGI